MPTWLVTGGSGFLGRHLLNRLLASTIPHLELFTLGRRLPPEWPADRFIPADLDDPASLSRGIASVSPDVVLHLAARTPPSDAPSLARSNVGGTVAIIRALRDLKRTCRLVSAGSAAELGPVPAHLLPVDERSPCRPEGFYGLSKWFAGRATIDAQAPIEGIVARIFNPIGPGLPTSQAFGRFASLLAAEGSGPITLQTGNLSPRRDFIDARDVADALIALALRGHPGRVYHVGTGRSSSIADGLSRLVALSGRRVRVDADPLPPPGPIDSRADITAIVRDTGWSPRIPIEESLADLWASLCPPIPRRPDTRHAGPAPHSLRRLPSRLPGD